MTGDMVAATDEDDHDPAWVELVAYDLALIKTLDQSQLPVYPEDDVTFTITIENQGNVPAMATGIEVTDYIATGLNLNDSNWTWDASAGTAITTLDRHGYTQLEPGDVAEIEITFTINQSYQGNGEVNWAEISNDDSDDTYGAFDIDSDPDASQGNDNQPAQP